jgi:SAM-dependent methyltransferase
MKNAQFDKFASTYDKILSNSLGSCGSDLTYYSSYKVDLVRSLVQKEVASILDFGCGIGNSVALLARAFPKATVGGCDVSPNALDVARRKNPDAHFFLPHEFLVETPPYDLGFVANVLHHVPPVQRPAWLANLLKRIKIGGDIFIFEHNPMNPIVRRIVRSCPLDEDAVLVSPGDLKRLVAHAGCHVQGWGYTLFFGPALRRMSFLEPWMRWLPLGAQYYLHVRHNGEH